MAKLSGLNIKIDKLVERRPIDDTVKELAQRACRLLARREFSAYELKQRFADSFSLDDCEEMLQHLIKQGAQSDDRFAEMLCQSRVDAGKGPVRIYQELQQHCISEETIVQAMTPYRGQWSHLAEQVRSRKFGPNYPTDTREWVRQLRFLQQRGFGEAEIAQYGISLEE